METQTGDQSILCKYISAVVFIMKRIMPSLFATKTISRHVGSWMMKCLRLYFLSLCNLVRIDDPLCQSYTVEFIFQDVSN